MALAQASPNLYRESNFLIARDWFIHSVYYALKYIHHYPIVRIFSEPKRTIQVQFIILTSIFNKTFNLVCRVSKKEMIGYSLEVRLSLKIIIHARTILCAFANISSDVAKLDYISPLVETKIAAVWISSSGSLIGFNSGQTLAYQSLSVRFIVTSLCVMLKILYYTPLHIVIPGRHKDAS